MKKILSFVLTAITAVGFVGWGALGAHAETTYTVAQVAQHNTASDCWLIISGQVYDVTNFIPIHPGGNAIVPYCGMDATAVFNSIHGSSGTAASELPTYLIGSLATALTAPTNLAGTPAQTTVALSWTGSTGGVSPITYAVIRNGSSVGTTTATAFTDTGLTASTTYAYFVQAFDSNTPTANTASSSQITVKTLAASGGGGSTSTPLTAPTNVTGTPTQTSIVLHWTGSTGGVSPVTYTIVRGATSVGTTSATTFTNTGLTPGTAYTFIVRATDSATPTANGTSSAQITVTTLAATNVGGGSGGEQENEVENETETENGHIATSTHQTGGGSGGESDDIGEITHSGGRSSGGGTQTSGGHSSGRHGSDD